MPMPILSPSLNPIPSPTRGDAFEARQAVAMASRWQALPVWCLALAVLLLCSTQACAQVIDPLADGKTLAREVCAACHGRAGEGVSSSYPRLAGQQAQYLSEQLQDLREHTRKNEGARESMWPYAALSDAQISQLANYFSAQESEPSDPPGADDPEGQAKLRRGRQIFLEGLPGRQVSACATCHGQQGQGRGYFPRLAGQYGDYVRAQLGVFQHTSDRPRAAMMEAFAHELQAPEIEALAVYIASMPAPTAQNLAAPNRP